MLVFLHPRVLSRVAGFPVASLCLWGKLENLSFSNVSKQVVMSFCVAGVALCDIPNLFDNVLECENWRKSRTKCLFFCIHMSHLESLVSPVASSCLWGKPQNLSFSKVSKQVVMSFCVAGVALCDIPSCLITCGKYQNGRKSRTKCLFFCIHASRLESLVSPVASSCLWGKPQNLSFSKVSKQVVMSFCVAGVALCDIPSCLITCGKYQNGRKSRTKCLFFCIHASRSSLWFFLWRRRVYGGSRKISPFRKFPSRLSCRFAWQAWHFPHSTLDTLHSSLYTPHSTHHTLHFPLQTPHSTLYAPHSTLYTPHSTLHTLHSTPHTLHSSLHTLHCTLHTPHFPLNTPHFTLHTLHSSLHALHSTLYTPHSTLYTPHFTLHTPHSTLYPPHSTLYTLHYTLYTPYSTLYTLHSTLHTLHFTLLTPHSTLYTPHSTLYTLHSTLSTLHSSLHTLHSTLCTPHSTLPTPHFTLHTPYFTLYTPHSLLHTPHSTLHTLHFPLHTADW